MSLPADYHMHTPRVRTSTNALGVCGLPTRMSAMKTRSIACGLAIAATVSVAYWAPTPIDQLTADSDCVVIGRVQQLTGDDSTHRVQVMMSDLQVVKGFKGLGSSVIFDAPFSLNSCVVVMGRDGKPLPPVLNSFTSNETCAVFLRFSRENLTKLTLVSDSDGKFSVDVPAQHLQRAQTADKSRENSLSLNAFWNEVGIASKRHTHVQGIPSVFSISFTNVTSR